MGLVISVITIVASIPTIDWFRGVWRRGPGARRDCERRLERLAVGATRSRFEEILGLGSASRIETNKAKFTMRLFHNEWCVVQVITDDHDTVHRFAVCSRHKKLKPTYRVGGKWPPVDIRLRESPLTALGEPDRIRSHVGAQTAYYIEEHYFGRPGHYRYYQAGFTETAMNDVAVLPDDFHRTLTDYTMPDDQVPPEIVRFRELNRVIVYGESLSPFKDDGHTFGHTMTDTWIEREPVTFAVRRSDRRFARLQSKRERRSAGQGTV
jgi:hypothetical protein